MQLGASDVAWEVPNVQVESTPAAAHVRVGWYRSVCNIPHAFGVCSFADELARAAKKDPKAFLEELIGPPRKVDLTALGVKDWNYGKDKALYPIETARMRHVLDLAARRAGLGTRAAGGRAGHRRAPEFRDLCASVVEVAIGTDAGVGAAGVDSGRCGFAANPDRVRSQMEGAAIMGIGNAITGR